MNKPDQNIPRATPEEYRKMTEEERRAEHQRALWRIAVAKRRYLEGEDKEWDT